MGINIGGLGEGKVNLILKGVFPSGFILKGFHYSFPQANRPTNSFLQFHGAVG